MIPAVLAVAAGNEEEALPPAKTTLTSAVERQLWHVADTGTESPAVAGYSRARMTVSI